MYIKEDGGALCLTEKNEFWSKFRLYVKPTGYHTVATKGINWSDEGFRELMPDDQWTRERKHINTTLEGMTKAVANDKVLDKLFRGKAVELRELERHEVIARYRKVLLDKQEMLSKLKVETRRAEAKERSLFKKLKRYADGTEVS